MAIGLGAAGLVFLIAWPGWLEVAELKTYDWRMRTLRQWSPSVHPDIVLVEINDATIRDLKEIAGRWPWPRALSAILIDYLHRGAPKVIAVDVGFWEKEREAVIHSTARITRAPGRTASSRKQSSGPATS